MGTLPETDQLGLGFNILGEYSGDSTLPRIVELPTVIGRQSAYGGVTYDVPKGIEVVQGQGSLHPTLTGSAMAFESRREVQSHFAAKAGVKGTYGGFSGAVEATFGSDSSVNESSWYVLLEAILELYHMSLSSFTLASDFSTDGDVKAMLASSTFDPAKPDVFFQVFSKWGTHVVTKATVGSQIDYVSTVSKSAASDKLSVEAKLNLEYKAVVGDVAANASADWSQLTKTWANARQSHLEATGGDESIMMPAEDPQFNDSFHDLYSNWVKTINANPKMIGFHLTPLSKLPGISGPVGRAIDQAITAYTDNGIYVEARISPQDLSGLVQVSGKNIGQRSYARRSGGAQLVVVDASNLTEVHEHTIYGAEGTWHTATDPNTAAALWAQLFQGTESLTTKDYFCALTVFCFHAANYPTGDPAKWLKRCGAKLDAWQDLGQRAPLDWVAYTFVGKSNSPSGQGQEQFDWDRGPRSGYLDSSGTAFASVTTPLVPQTGGGFTLSTT
jgi:hypothetical protein